VTSRRLNRVEYNNTIRDLLGVTIRPADEFPIDDSGYGFDNIGDVLSLSPMLMEKYVNAARVVARAAVFGEAYPEKPGQLIVLTPKKMQDDLQTKGNETPYSMRGTLYATYHFRLTASTSSGGDTATIAVAESPSVPAGRSPAPRLRQRPRCLRLTWHPNPPPAEDAEQVRRDHDGRQPTKNGKRGRRNFARPFRRF
jgi:hypothetical protein